LKNKEYGKAAIPGQGLQAAFPVKPPRVEGCFGYFISPKHFPVNSDSFWTPTPRTIFPIFVKYQRRMK